MIRGTTPTLILSLPVAASTLTSGYITFARDGQVLLEKTLDDCTAQDMTLRLPLSQEDTLALRSGMVKLQLRALNASGQAVASHILETTVEAILKDGVI